MVKVCPVCDCINDDDAQYCKACGCQLMVDGSNYHFDVSYLQNRSVVVGYILAILFGWGGVILSLLSTINNSLLFMGFFGLIFPFDLIRADDPSVRKHGYIQLIICVTGVIVQSVILLSFLGGL